MNEFKPAVFRGIGSHLRIEKPKAVTCGADAMPKADRRIIEEPVAGRLGASGAAALLHFKRQLGQSRHPGMPVVST